jgi:hypothetical protein
MQYNMAAIIPFLVVPEKVHLCRIFAPDVSLREETSIWMTVLDTAGMFEYILTH